MNRSFSWIIVYLKKMILKKDCFASRQYKGYRYNLQKKNFEKIKIKNEFIFLQTHYSDNYSDKLNIGFI